MIVRGEKRTKKKTYPLGIPRKCTPDEMFQARQFICNLDDRESLLRFSLSGFNDRFFSEEVFPEIRYEENR